MNSKQIINHFKEEKMNIKTYKNDQYCYQIVYKLIDAAIFFKQYLTIVPVKSSNRARHRGEAGGVEWRCLRGILKSLMNGKVKSKNDGTRLLKKTLKKMKETTWISSSGMLKEISSSLTRQ